MPLRSLDASLRHTVRLAASPALRPSRLSQPAAFHDIKGVNLGAVWLPDMARIEAVPEAQVMIPSAPDAYTVSRSNTAAAQSAGAFTTVASPATHLGGGPSSTGGAAK